MTHYGNQLSLWTRNINGIEINFIGSSYDNLPPTSYDFSRTKTVDVYYWNKGKQITESETKESEESHFLSITINYHRQVNITFGWWGDTWDAVKEWFSHPENVKRISNICVIVGGILSILGLVLAPVSYGASLSISLVGGALAITGAGLDVIINEMENRRIRMVRNGNGTVVTYVELYENVVNDLDKLATLYIKGVHTDYIMAAEIRRQSNVLTSMARDLRMIDNGPSLEFEKEFNSLVKKEKINVLGQEWREALRVGKAVPRNVDQVKWNTLLREADQLGLELLDDGTYRKKNNQLA